MNKLFGILIFTCFINIISLQAQPTDRPLHNFYVDKETKTIYYQQFFTADNQNSKTIIQKLRSLLVNPDKIKDLQFDSSSVFRGHFKNISPSYYGGAKNLEGDFNIVVKDGKYRVYIHDMYWNTEIAINGNEKLEDMNINSKGTEWKQFAYNVLPDLDEIFTNLFSINPTSPTSTPDANNAKTDTSWVR